MTDDKIWCEYCNVWHNKEEIQKRRLNTNFVKEDSNYMTSCEAQFEEVVKAYEELKHDYYSSIF